MPQVGAKLGIGVLPWLNGCLTTSPPRNGVTDFTLDKLVPMWYNPTIEKELT